MAEKREIEHIAGVKPDDGRTYIHTNIGFDRSADTKYEVYLPVPKTDEEAKDDYDCDLATLVESGVRQLSTRPDYKTVGFNEDGTLKKGGHEAMQAMADNYKVGARVAGEGIKSKAVKLDGMVAKYGGGSQDELEAKLAKMEELEKQGLL
jgi:hypothetical protein